MKVRKILGSIENFKQTHCIAKLENGKYVVGNFTVGSYAGGAYLHDELDAAVDYWWDTLQTSDIRHQTSDIRHQTSDHQTIRPSDHQTIRPSDHQTIRPSDHQTIRPSEKSL